MADELFTVKADATEVLSALARYPEVFERHAKPMCRITANNVAERARSRVRIRSGATKRGITVEESRDGKGYVVYNKAEDRPDGEGRLRRGHHVALYLEEGTVHMSARPFWRDSVRSEEGAHYRRIVEAAESASEELGLGD